MNGPRDNLKLIRLLADPGWAYGREIILSAAMYGHQHRHWALYVERDFDPARPLRGEVDGAIAQTTSSTLARRLAALDLPVVNISGRVANVPLPSVLPDDHAAGRLAAEHLLERGFTHFGYAAIPGHAYSDRRLAGFAAAAGEAGFDVATYGLSPDEHVDKKGGRGKKGKTDSGEKASEERRREYWLAEQPKPLGLMACNDNRARQFVNACQRIGLRVPEDVALVGVDNDPLQCQTAGLPLSSVDLNCAKIGYEAARLLDSLFAGEAPPQEPLLIAPAGVVSRRSSDVMAIEDLDVLKAMQFIRDHATKPIGVEHVLAQVPLSRRALELRFRQAIGRGVHAQIRRMRIRHAQRLLIESDLAVGRIAELCGFTEPYYFSIAFRRETGMTPRAYRQQQRCG